MRIPIVPYLLLLLLGLLVDWYICRRIRRAGCRPWILRAYVAVAVAVIGCALWVGLSPKKTIGDASLLTLMWTLFGYLSVYIPKYIFALFEIVRGILARLTGRRLRGIAIAGGVVAGLVFGAMWWGALVERFRIDVREVEVTIPGLPAAFDGYRIVQLSDIHSGTYGDNPAFLLKVVEKVNALKPDAVLFTGDIVNRHSSELEPFVSTLAGIAAPDSVWSIMGNHDYADYSEWPTYEAKLADISNLRRMQAEMGWHLLDNRHVMLRRDNDSIALIGVENIGDPPFHSYGSLALAYPTPGDSVVKILMSHNPAHWNSAIADSPDMNIALTLAGHTHAMQIEVLGLSPASLRYPTWGGLYTDSHGRHLYVNIGLGEVGFPARIGATPEITLITLRP